MRAPRGVMVIIVVMARHTTVTVTDDVDGSVNAKEVTFGWDGTWWTIDLSAKNRGSLEKALKPYLAKATKQTGQGAGRRLAVPAHQRGSQGERRARTWATYAPGLEAMVIRSAIVAGSAQPYNRPTTPRTDELQGGLGPRRNRGAHPSRQVNRQGTPIAECPFRGEVTQL